MKETLKAKFKFLSIKTINEEGDINSIEFLPTNDELINKISVVNIQYPTLYDENFVPIKGGPMDLRLGITKNNEIYTNKHCETCNNDILGCVGHFGHINLALPVFNGGYMKIIYNILQCVCKNCGMFLIFNTLTKTCFKEAIEKYNLDYLSENETDNSIIKYIKTFNKTELNKLIDKSRNIKICNFCNKKNGKLNKKQEKIQYNDIETNNVEPKEYRIYNCNIQNRVFEKYPFLNNKTTNNNEIERTFDLENFTAITCLNLFKTENMKKYWIYFLNIDPSHFIINKLLILPNCLRPTTILTSSKSNEDDLTVKSSEILHINNSLISNIEKNINLKSLLSDYEALQLHVNLYINSSSTGLTGTGFNIKMIKGIVQRLKGKGGRFRNNLSGKRVDFSARTVITPDPFLKICQVGIPEKMAEILTIEEEVNEININKLKELILNSPNYPCVNFITTYVNLPGEEKISRKIKKKVHEKFKENLIKELKIGDKVERQLLDNDIVLFNRQPSLHRISIMAHRVKIQKTRTLSFNESVCAPYNADFDGDEMNIHVLQTLASQAEADQIMSVNHNIINKRNNSIAIMPTQDFLTYLFKITSSKPINYDKSIVYSNMLFINTDYNNLNDFINFTDKGLDFLNNYKLKPVILRPQKLYSGYQIFDVLIFKSVLEEDTPFYITRNKGTVFYKKIFKKTNFKMSDILNKTPTSCSKSLFLKKSNRFSSFNNKTAFSHNKLKQINFESGGLLIKEGVLIKGTFTKTQTSEFIKYLRYLDTQISNNFINNVSRSSANCIHKFGFSIGLDDVFINRTEYKREVINDILNKISSLEDLEENKREALTIKEVGNLRDLLGISITKYISLPNFNKELNNILPAINSPLQMYRAGSKGSLLNIIQMICAVGQQVVGGSRIPSINGRSFVHVSNEIRNKGDLLKVLISRGLIIDSFYTGLNPISFFCHAVSGREGLVDTAVKTAETGYMQRRLMKGLEDGQLGYDGLIRFNKQIISFSQKLIHPKFSKSKNVNELIENMIYNLIGSENINYLKKNLAEEKYDFIKKNIFKYLCGITKYVDLQSSPVEESIGRLKFKGNKNLEYLMFKIYSYFSSWKFLNKQAESDNKGPSKNMKGDKNDYKKKLRTFLNIHEEYLLTSISNMLPLTDKYLTPVGSLAAQSIGEPGTQMTLKTFHFAGAMSMNITLGVPRLKEIINGSVGISTSISKVYLRTENNLRDNKKVIKKEKFLKNLFGNENCLIKRIEKEYPGRKEIKNQNEICFQNYVSPKRLRDILISLEIIYTALEIKIELKINQKIFDELNFSFSFFNKMKGDKSNDILINSILKKIKKAVSIEDVEYFDYKIILKPTNEIVFKIEKIKSSLLDLQITPFPVKRVLLQEGKNYDIINSTPLILEGSNLHELLALPLTFTVITNDIKEIEAVLGIEAARHAIIYETIYTLDSHGIFVNKEHILFLADSMCSSGVVSGVTRFGIPEIRKKYKNNLEIISPLLMASFEQTADNLYTASIKNVTDDVEGISERVIVGKDINLGTGQVEIC